MLLGFLLLVFCNSCNRSKNENANAKNLTVEERAKLYVYLSNIWCFPKPEISEAIADTCHKFRLLQYPLHLKKKVIIKDTTIFEFEYNFLNYFGTPINNNCIYISSVGFIGDLDTIRFAGTNAAITFLYYTYSDLVKNPEAYPWVASNFVDSARKYHAPYQYIYPCIIEKLKENKYKLDPWLKNHIPDKPGML